jgi:hypothetical protein
LGKWVPVALNQQKLRKYMVIAKNKIEGSENMKAKHQKKNVINLSIIGTRCYHQNDIIKLIRKIKVLNQKVLN